ncbi:MAG: M23 family metallopeptidase [Synechococcus sp.]|nr:M23 family metallopeptidase [Synechococcus sp.]
MLNLQFYLRRSRRLLKAMLLGVITCALVLGFNLMPHLQSSPLAIAQAQTRISTNNSWRQASFPVENFQSYTSGFGYRISPTSGQRQFHQGLDIAAPLGSYVRNWWSGKVVGLSDNSACGTMIQIKSGDWEHIYCHLSGYVSSSGQGTFLMDRNGGIQLWLGQEVNAGTRIGRVGMTGRTTGPHLHWGLKYSGNYVDPALVLQAMYNQPTASLDDLVQPT